MLSFPLTLSTPNPKTLARQPRLKTLNPLKKTEKLVASKSLAQVLRLFGY